MVEAFGVPIKGTPGDQHVRPGGRRAGHRGRSDTTVDFHVAVAAIDDGCHLGDLGFHCGDVFLASEPRIDGHDKNQAHQVAHLANHLGRGVGVQGQARRRP